MMTRFMRPPWIATTLISVPLTSWGHLPTPPEYAYSPDGDWLTVAQHIGNKSVHLFLIFMGVALLGGVASGLLRGYQTAQERQEMSHFFKALGVGLICVGLGFGLLYGAHLIISTGD